LGFLFWGPSSHLAGEVGGSGRLPDGGHGVRMVDADAGLFFGEQTVARRRPTGRLAGRPPPARRRRRRRRRPAAGVPLLAVPVPQTAAPEKKTKRRRRRPRVVGCWRSRPFLSQRTRWQQVLPVVPLFLPSFTGFYRVLQGFTGFYWVLPSFTKFYWVLLGLTKFYRALRGLPRFTKFYRVLPSFNGCYRVLPISTRLNRV